MKRLMSFFLLIILVGILIGCNKTETRDKVDLKESEYQVSDFSQGVNLFIENDNIDKNTEEITLNLINLSDIEYVYGKEPHLEMESEEKWYIVPTLDNVAWEDIGIILSPRGSNKDVFPLRDFYGELEKGNYRIIKSLYADGDSIFIMGEFTVQ